MEMRTGQCQPLDVSTFFQALSWGIQVIQPMDQPIPGMILLGQWLGGCRDHIMVDLYSNGEDLGAASANDDELF